MRTHDIQATEGLETCLPAFDGGGDHAHEQLEYRLALVRLCLAPRPAWQTSTVVLEIPLFTDTMNMLIVTAQQRAVLLQAVRRFPRSATA